MQNLQSWSIRKIECLAFSHKCFLAFKQNQICNNKRKVQNQYHNCDFLAWLFTVAYFPLWSMIPHTSANYRSNKSLKWVGFCYCSYRVGDGSQKRRKTVRSPVDLSFLFSFHLSQSNTWLVHYTTLPINWIMQVWNIELLPINTSHKLLLRPYSLTLFPNWSPSLPATDLLLSSNCTRTHFLVLILPYINYMGMSHCEGCVFQAI